ncbi:M48 family metallopeptidase [Candidatus Oleimmundimicrobium sp.]|uniref:M48 metallopeptidase family protein n=1 Tax=Candidatus Oleimmundimicrobium sp. TaxID=3060597 RepID=UPI0027220DFE|nr:M48 family metallopeptidase [Candidatus Oleimmundimicrobium sp.]MDO8885963.1 M48 family metallopeptidase [Candidatus Oleimmundimicrobium sp.]
MAHEVSYRNVKHPRLEFRTGELLLVLPFDRNPDTVLEKHKVWVRRKKVFIEECLKNSSNKEIIDRTDEELRDLVHFYIEEASEELGVRVNKIFFRRMKTKWASCSTRRNLTVNTLMKHLPDGLIEYVIFHEATHLIEKKHNDRFWKMVSKKFDNSDELEKDLFAYWFLIQDNNV